MAVRSRAMRDDQVVDDEEQGQARRRRAVAWSVGSVLLAFGAAGWIVGGRYTVEGWVIWINRLLGWLGVVERLPVPIGWVLLGLVVVIGLIYSRVEVTYRPWRRVDRRWVLAPPLLWAAWTLIILTDMGSTFQGLIVPPPANAEQWLKDLASSEGLAGVAAIVLTFGPEWLILGGWKLLKG